ncbi:MAG TPA: DNA-processing protein DprA, partial [Candidatus Saccharimonadales bacterium]|nr:DNA-processing protein DprA [Candidatus Saccharimonadales bacterium]
MDVNTLKFTDAEFPRLLEHLSSPPKQLYWSGRAPNDWINKPKVAIVGSRKLTPYGKTITNRLAGQLSRAGVVIISGLAYGIDVTAHLAALDAGGLTVAV